MLRLVDLVILLVVGLISWTVPRQLFVLTPPRWRPVLYGPRASWWRALAVAPVPLVLAFPVGYAMDDPQMSHVEMGALFAALMGGIVSGGLLFSWRRARREQRYAEAAPGPALPRQGTPPWLLDLPTAPAAALVRVDSGAFRAERALRRSRTVLLALVPVLGVLFRIQGQSGSDHRFWGAFAVLAVVVTAALVIPQVLHLRAKKAAGDVPSLLGGVVTYNDTDRVADRFPHAPLLHRQNRFDRLLQPVVVDGETRGRHWWVVEQHAAMHGQQQPMRRTTCLVWLPGVDLPGVLVRGRDDVELTRWFATGLALESWDFGQRLHVLADASHAREATALLHPRLMEHLLAYLPDGGGLVVRGDLLALVLHRAVHLSEVESTMSFLLTCADLIPAFLLKERAVSRP